MKQWRALRKPVPHLAPIEWFNWLNDRGSLTQRLVNLSGGQFQVEVVSNAFSYPRPDEYRTLNIGARRLCLIREVNLKGKGKTWVTARTIIPTSSLCGPQRSLKSLGNRSLGSHLFRAASMRRGAIEIAHTDSNQWARRSVFWLSGRPLLVQETFLPALLKAH